MSAGPVSRYSPQSRSVDATACSDAGHAAGTDRPGRPDAVRRCRPDITYRLCAWKPPRGLLARLPQSARRSSRWAQASITCSPTRRCPAVPVVRIVDPDLTMRMTEYVVLHVLMHHRAPAALRRAAARNGVWHEHAQPAGERGRGRRDGARRARPRCRARCWCGSVFASRAGAAHGARGLPGVGTFDGAAGLDAFLARTEILVCLLPHTPATEGNLNLALLRKLKRDGGARRRVPDQRRPRPAAGRHRHRGGARRRRRDRRERPSTCFRWREPDRPRAAVGSAQRDDHAAQFGGLGATRRRSPTSWARSSASRPAKGWRT